MSGQNQILRRLSQPHNVERVSQLMAESPELHRSGLADRLCDEFNFRSPRGKRQRSGCLKALRRLESKGCFSLPPRRREPVPTKPRRLESSVPPPKDVPSKAGDVHGLRVVLVETEEHMRIWNSLFHDEHPRGAGPLVGRQLRYLVASDYGWLGGFGFAASALHLDARDRWIGWDLKTRETYLERVVGMVRFLIRPSVHCKNLASRVLSLAMARMPQDFEARYGYLPWLAETFVDKTQFAGTCYKAANWVRVGSTRGRGRQDRDNQKAETTKDIYLYVLDQDFRTHFGLPAHAGLGALPLDAGLESESWAEREFGGAPLGDKRLSQRLVQSASLLAKNPMRSFPAAAGGDHALIKAHYRLLDKPDHSKVTMENILAPHRQQTIRRMMAHNVVLCVQDGTDLDYNGAAQCEGLGVIGTNQTKAKTKGLHMHSTLAVTEEGLPIGVLRSQCSAPISRGKKDKRKTHEIPIKEKETYSWILSMTDCETVAAEMPHTQVVQVMDRDADFFELFDHWRENTRKKTHLLVRAQHDRRTTSESNLFDSVKAAEVQHRLDLHIGRQSVRPKRSKKKAHPGRKERVATMALRYQQVDLRPPRYIKGKEPLRLWVVHMVEENPPSGVQPIEWFLLTTMELTSPEQAVRLVGWYCLRWRIEDWHRVLKSGCEIQELRNETAERLKRAIAIYLVIAWRVMLMTLLGREVPDLPPDVLFSDIELEVLGAYAETRRDLKPPVRLGDAVRIVARMAATWTGNTILHPAIRPSGSAILSSLRCALAICCT